MTVALLGWLVWLGCEVEPEETVSEDSDAGVSVTAPADFSIELDALALLAVVPREGISYFWYFGDETTAEGHQVEHSWSRPGTFQVVVEALAGSGDRATDALTVVVHPPLAEVPPRSSSGVALAEDAVWVVVPEANHVRRISFSGEVLSTTETCGTPRTVAIGASRALVACDEDAIAHHDLDGSLLEVEYLPVGSRPYGVVGRGESFFVTLQGTGEVLPVVEDEVPVSAAPVEVGPDPRGIALAPDDTVYVSRWRSDGVGELYVVDGEHRKLPTEDGPDSDTSIRGVPNLLGAPVVSPDGGFLVVPSTLSNIFRGQYRDGELLTHETRVRAHLAWVKQSNGAVVFAKQFDDQGAAHAVAFSPLGDRIYVAHGLTGTLHVVDTWTGAIVDSALNVGVGFVDLAVSEDGTRLYAHAWLDRKLHAYDTADLVGGPVFSAPTVDDEPLEAEVLEGKRIFWNAFDTRMAKDGYLTCATCHPDGRDDGQVWDFTQVGEGLRNTISLEGRGGTAMGPLHWTANFDEVQDFEHDIRGGFGGTGFLTDDDFGETNDTLGTPKAGRSAELDALAAYVTSLTETPASPHPGSAQGEALFESEGCDECHPAPLYTDSSLDDSVRHDVGTTYAGSGGRLGGELDGFDTPTLLGVWDTGPWLHDGSATTIEDAISAHEGVGLAGDDLAAVAEFVRGL